MTAPCGCGKKGVAAVARAAAEMPALAEFNAELHARYAGVPNEKGPRTLGGVVVPMTQGRANAAAVQHR